MNTSKRQLPSFKHSGSGKKEFVEKMFDDISPHYDFLNHLLSLGMDIYWRKIFIRNLDIQNGKTLIDVACGTGDIGFTILKSHKIKLINIDLSKNMLGIAKKKALKKKLYDIHFIQGDAEILPLENDSIDCLTIAYGFRNIAHYDKALEEFYRVLKPGGKLSILEFSKSKTKFFNTIFQIYFNKILPKLASLISRADAYRYLPESVKYFPDETEISKFLSDNNFIDISSDSLTLGVATIYTGIKN